MVGKEDIYRMLREEEIWHEITEHPAVYNMEEMAQIQLPYPEADAKNLFVRDSKRRDYYLITVRGDKRVDLKQFRQQNQTRSLSFASAEELGELLGLIPGAVTPLGLLNDGDRRVSFYLDASFCRPEAQKIGVHPNDNTATLWLQVEDLLRLIRAPWQSRACGPNLMGAKTPERERSVPCAVFCSGPYHGPGLCGPHWGPKSVCDPFCPGPSPAPGLGHGRGSSFFSM